MKSIASTDSDCPLTPALIELLQVAVTHDTTNTKEIADLQCKSPATINTQFKNICTLMNLRSRDQAVIIALKRGWISLENPVEGRKNEIADERLRKNT